jgi:hypothetical protein
MTPIILQPPFPLAPSPALWVAASGPMDSWTGADVGWSEDGEDYARHEGGHIGAACVTGTLRTTLPAVVGNLPVACLVLLDGDTPIKSVERIHAAHGQTLCSIGDELVAFQSVRFRGRERGRLLFALLAPLHRGWYGTRPTTHPPGTRFAWWTDEVAKFPLPHRLVAAGATITLKLLPFSGLGEPIVEPDGVIPTLPVFPFTLSPGRLPHGT